MLLIFHYYSKSFKKMFSFVIMQHFVKSCQECKIFDESLLTFPVSPQKFLKCLKYKKSNLTENNLKSHPDFFFFFLLFKITQPLACHRCHSSKADYATCSSSKAVHFFYVYLFHIFSISLKNS